MRNLAINTRLAVILARRTLNLAPLRTRFRAPRAPSGRYLPLAWALAAESLSPTEAAWFRPATQRVGGAA